MNNSESQLARKWGDEIKIYPSGKFNDTITFYPKWWQFWKKPKTVCLSEAIKNTQEMTYAKMINQINERMYL